MKKITLDWSLFVFVLLSLFITSCEKIDPQMEKPSILMETAKAKGDIIDFLFISRSDSILIDYGSSELVPYKSEDKHFYISHALQGTVVKVYGKDIYMINCSDQMLTKLEFNNLTQLYLLYCHNNNLSSLDLSANDKMEALICYGNHIDELILGNLSSKFQFIDISDNKLDACALDEIYKRLPKDKSRIVPFFVTSLSERNSNDIDGSNVTIATSKNWFVCQRSDTASHFILEKAYTVDGNACNK